MRSHRNDIPYRGDPVRQLPGSSRSRRSRTRWRTVVRRHTASSCSARRTTPLPARTARHGGLTYPPAVRGVPRRHGRECPWPSGVSGVFLVHSALAPRRGVLHHVVALARALAAARLVIDVDIAATVDHAGCSRPPPSLPRRYKQIAGGVGSSSMFTVVEKRCSAGTRGAAPVARTLLPALALATFLRDDRY